MTLIMMAFTFHFFAFSLTQKTVSLNECMIKGEIY